jgi:penicillin-binding protein 1A
LTNEIARNLNLYDVVYVHVSGQNGGSTKGSDAGSSKGNVQARLRVRPSVQGAALVLENTTGRVLAMAGSFSYP